MGSQEKSRSKKRAQIRRPSDEFDVGFCYSKTLFQSPEGMKPNVLKSLYSVLDNVCSQDSEIGHEEIKLKLGDIHELSTVLFNCLEERFECISADSDTGENSSSSGLFESVEVVSLLLRCCMLVILHESNQAFRLEMWLKLSKLLRDKLVEPHNRLLFLMSTMLEVFVDEVLACEQLRGYFGMLNSYAQLFNSQSAPRDIGIEAICNHFLLSFSIEQDFGDSLTRLSCTHAIERKYRCRVPALRLTTAVSLFLSPMMMSSPKYVQAHIASLVSEAIGIRSLKPDREVTNCFVSTFEKSVTLYMRYMSCLQTDGYAILLRGFTSNSSHDIAYPPFELYITPETKDKVDSLITKLDNSSNLNTNGSFFRMKSDLVSSSMRFVKESLDAYALTCHDKILAVLSCLVLKASESSDAEKVRPIEGANLQEICLLASLLKLMSISLVQAIHCLRHSDDDSGYQKTLKDISCCKAYKFILGTTTCFRDLDCSLPFQQILSTSMSSHSTRHVDSKMIFLHFSGLMSRSFATGLDCLVKASLLMILALLNLFIFEEGDLDALQSLLDFNEESSPPYLSVVKFQKTVPYQSSSRVVASKFNQIRSLYPCVNGEVTSSSKALALASHMEGVSDIEKETVETSNVEIYLKCIATMDGTNYDMDDLVSFVECRPGKDYIAWMKNCERFRKWRFKKAAALRRKRERKNKSWRRRVRI